MQWPKTTAKCWCAGTHVEPKREGKGFIWSQHCLLTCTIPEGDPHSQVLFGHCSLADAQTVLIESNQSPPAIAQT